MEIDVHTSIFRTVGGVLLVNIFEFLVRLSENLGIFLNI